GPGVFFSAARLRPFPGPSPPRLARAVRESGGPYRSPLRTQGEQGPETRPETAEVKAPPHAHGHRHQALVGQAGAEDAARRPRGEPADQEAEGNQVGPTAEGVEVVWPRARGVGPWPLPGARGTGEGGGVSYVSRA